MEYKFWESAKGRFPVLEELLRISSADSVSGKAYWMHLNRLEKYNFAELTRHRLLKKLKGRNPYKLFELRFSLPRKIARTFSVIDKEGRLWLLYLVVKKQDKTKQSDIETAQQRAAKVETEIHYL